MENISPEVINPRREEVVMIDDEPDIVSPVREMFDEEGWGGRLFDNPEVALEYILQKRKNILLVVTDLNMPGMSGVEVARKVKTEDKDIEVILTSANTGRITPQQREELTVLGVEIMEKPYKPVKMLEIADELKKRNDSLGVKTA